MSFNPSFDNDSLFPQARQAWERSGAALSQMGSDASSPFLSGFDPSSDGTQAFTRNQYDSQVAEGKLANAGLDAQAQMIDARNQKGYYEGMAKAQAGAQKRSQSNVGGILGGLGSVASFIPGVGPLIGAGLKVAGGAFG